MKRGSILTDDFEKCYICGSHQLIEVHHIFGAANRKLSTQYGLVVPLCKYCHNLPPNGVHHNRKNALKLKAEAQEAAMLYYSWSKEEFRRIFGKNYL